MLKNTGRSQRIVSKPTVLHRFEFGPKNLNALFPSVQVHRLLNFFNPLFDEEV